ncbi:hypothetical protein A2U01_0115947, partial [Trifolium medium]|nr:hypothetical protein [Trifolium medium]
PGALRSLAGIVSDLGALRSLLARVAQVTVAW